MRDKTPVLAGNKTLAAAFEAGATTYDDLERHERLAVIAEYLRNLTAGGAFSQDAWEFLVESQNRETIWKPLIAAIVAKANCVNTGNTHLQLVYQARAQDTVNDMLHGLEEYARKFVDHALEHMAEAQTETDYINRSTRL